MNTINLNTNHLNEIIIDVRTKGEWNMEGHADCTVNIPLDQFESHVDELKKFRKIILVCRSGNRAGLAQSILLNNGYKGTVENKGPWQNITCKTQTHEIH